MPAHESRRARRSLVLGGARSGKSAHAEGLVGAAEPVTYLATARTDPADAEWAARIAAHRDRRPAHWATVETRDTGELVTALVEGDSSTTLLVDDVATWLTGVLDDTEAWQRGRTAMPEIEQRLDALISATTGCAARLIFVSAEVGLGVIPATASGRLFRDTLGIVNARLAEVSDEVVLLVAGIPLRLR